MAGSVLDIFQRTQEVTQRGLLYVGEGTSDKAIAKDPELRELQEAIGGFGTEELAELILDEASEYSSSDVGRRLTVMVKRFLTLQDKAAADILTSGPVTVTRTEESRPYTIADFTGDEAKDIWGPVTGTAGEVYPSLGWFNLATKEMEVSVKPLDYRGRAQVDIEVG